MLQKRKKEKKKKHRMVEAVGTDPRFVFERLPAKTEEAASPCDSTGVLYSISSTTFLVPLQDFKRRWYGCCVSRSTFARTWEEERKCNGWRNHQSLTIQRQGFPKELDILLRFLREPTTSSIVPKICSIKRTYLGGVCQSTA